MSRDELVQKMAEAMHSADPYAPCDDWVDESGVKFDYLSMAGAGLKVLEDAGLAHAGYGVARTEYDLLVSGVDDFHFEPDLTVDEAWDGAVAACSLWAFLRAENA